MAAAARLRRAVRALVIDHGERVLLVRLEFPSWVGWALPGGGVEDGEDDLDAIRRELAEEVGLTDPVLVGPIWQRTVVFTEPALYDGQVEHIFLVRCAPFVPTPLLSPDRLRAEGVTDMRWWSAAELTASAETIAPSRLAVLLAGLASGGATPPALPPQEFAISFS